MSFVFRTIADVRADVDRLSVKVDALESRLCRGVKVTDKEFITLTEFLMVQLLKLDSIMAEGETKMQRKSELEAALTHGGKSDINAADLFSELQVLIIYLPEGTETAIQVLEFVESLDCLPNVSIAYRILLTVPVTVASAERSFSKLKLLKNFLRSTMSQERMNGLAMLCIERHVLESCDFEAVIDDFASQNAVRSKIFK